MKMFQDFTEKSSSTGPKSTILSNDVINGLKPNQQLSGITVGPISIIGRVKLFSVQSNSSDSKTLPQVLTFAKVEHFRMASKQPTLVDATMKLEGFIGTGVGAVEQLNKEGETKLESNKMELNNLDFCEGSNSNSLITCTSSAHPKKKKRVVPSLEEGSENKKKHIFACNICLKTYTCKNGLKYHLSNHHLSPEEKMKKIARSPIPKFYCEIPLCTKSFVNKSGLTYHQRTFNHNRLSLQKPVDPVKVSEDAEDQMPSTSCTNPHSSHLKKEEKFVFCPDATVGCHMKLGDHLRKRLSSPEKVMNKDTSSQTTKFNCEFPFCKKVFVHESGLKNHQRAFDHNSSSFQKLVIVENDAPLIMGLEPQPQE